MKQYIYFAALFILVCATGACSDRDHIEVLRISVLPDQSNKQLKKIYTPLIKYLTDNTGIEHRLVLSKSYADILEQFVNGKIDIALFGGFTFVKAHAVSGAIPLVMRDSDIRFKSLFLVRTDSVAKSLNEFKGQKFAFGSELSTSGHLMPRFFLTEKDINPEQFFSEVQYSGAHDRTVEWVKTGKVDLGVANAIVVNDLLERAVVSSNDVRILWTTPPYADYVWSSRAEIPESIRKKIIEAFLALSTSDPQQAEILKALGAKYYLPATINDFSSLVSIGRQLALIPEK